MEINPRFIKNLEQEQVTGLWFNHSPVTIGHADSFLKRNSE